MKIRVVSSRDEIAGLNPSEKIIHLAFRPSSKDIFMIVEACPRLEAIQVPKSYMNTIARSIEMFLDINNIRLLEGDVWGHRKDINEYYFVSDDVVQKIAQLKDEDMPYEKIIEKIRRESKLSKDMILFLLTKKHFF